MQRINDVDVLTTIEELVEPAQTAVLVIDMQNYLLSKESQNTLMDVLRMRPVRTDVSTLELPAQLMIPSEVFERHRLPWPHPGYKREYKARWSQEVIGR